MKRWTKSMIGAAVAAALVVGGGGVAYADDLQTSQSVDSLEVSTPANLGVLACGSEKVVDVTMFIRRTSNAANNTFKSKSTATYSIVSSSNVSVSPPSPASITLPEGWDALDPSSHVASPASNSKVTVAAGTSNGTFSGSVTYKVAGTAENNSSLEKTAAVSVTWKVENCGQTPADTTPPVVVLTCPSEPVSRGDVASASWTASDEVGGSGLATAASGSLPLDTSTLGAYTAVAPIGTAVDNAGNESAVATCSYEVVDRTPPVVTLLCPTDPVARGSVAYAHWTAMDEEGGSGIADPASGSILLDTSTLGDFAATAEAGTAHDNAGNASLEVTCGYTVVDRTPPVVTLSCPVDPVLLGTVAEATWTAADEDGGSGLATAASGSIALNTSSVGTKKAVAPAGTAVDNAGNESEAKECAYSVVFDFAGFFRPVDMGNVVNSVKAGSAVPMKFSLGGDQGLGIIEAGYPKFTPTNCKTGLPVDEIESGATVTAGGSTLTYDAEAGQYVYVWKTEKSWANTCGTFAMKLVDGTTKTALFKFPK